MKERTDQLDFIKIKNFCSVKDAFKKMKRQVTDCIAKDLSDKGLLSKIYKELLKFNNKRTNNPIKKCAKDVRRYTDRK